MVRIGNGENPLPLTEWSLHGAEFNNCSCNWGCPCQFNSLPSNGDCRAHMFIQIDEGRFGDIPLDGLRFGGLFSWPGPIHLGNGTVRRIIDERASPKQRDALEAMSEAVLATADHIDKFWDPRMKQAIFADDERFGVLTPIAAEAIDHLATGAHPEPQTRATKFNSAHEVGHSDAG